MLCSTSRAGAVALYECMRVCAGGGGVGVPPVGPGAVSHESRNFIPIRNALETLAGRRADCQD